MRSVGAGVMAAGMTTRSSTRSMCAVVVPGGSTASVAGVYASTTAAVRHHQLSTMTMTASKSAAMDDSLGIRPQSVRKYRLNSCGSVYVNRDQYARDHQFRHMRRASPIVSSSSSSIVGESSSPGVRHAHMEAASNTPNRWQVSMVTGASRGIGLTMVKHLLARGGDVVAACRDPMNSPELTSLMADSGGRLLPVAMDVTSESSILQAAEEVAKRHARLDLLVNVVGILHNTQLNMMPETALNKVTAENMLLSYQTNAMGPLLVAKAFTDLLSARARDSSDGVGVLASVSARVGSISDNRLGGWYSYRASKAALNMSMVNVALENTRRKRPFSCIMLHPGTVDTDLSKPFQVWDKDCMCIQHKSMLNE